MNVSGDLSNILALAQAASGARIITEDSAALAFAQEYAGQFLYDHDAGAWFSWSGYHWQRECTRLAYEWARGLVRDLTEGAAVKVQAISRKTSFVGGVEKFASVDRTFAIE